MQCIGLGRFCANGQLLPHLSNNSNSFDGACRRHITLYENSGRSRPSRNSRVCKTSHKTHESFQPSTVKKQQKWPPSRRASPPRTLSLSTPSSSSLSSLASSPSVTSRLSSSSDPARVRYSHFRRWNKRMMERIGRLSG